MRKVLLPLLFCCIFATIARAQTATDSLTDSQLQTLGITRPALDKLQDIYTGKGVTAALELSIQKVLFANVAGNRQLWRIDFAANYPADNSNVIFYIDADSDAQTGRTKAGGTDLMIWVENSKPRTAFYESDTTRRTSPPAFVVISGAHLYVCTDIDLHQQEGQLNFRMSVLAQTAQPLKTVDHTPFFAAKSPASTDTKTPRIAQNAVPSHPVLADLAPLKTTQNGVLPGWKIVDTDGSASDWKLNDTILDLHKTNEIGSLALQSDLLAARPATTYKLSAQVNVPKLSAANVYFSIKQFLVGQDSGRGILGSAVRPIYDTNGAWQDLTFYFTTQQNVDRVQIQLVFADAPIDAHIKNMQLTAFDPAQRKTRYETPTPETLIPQADAEKVLLARPRATAQVRTEGDRPRFFVDGKETVPLFYKTPGAWKLERSHIDDFRDAGVRVYFLSYYLGRGIYQTKEIGGWIGENKTDFSELDAMLWQILRADPHGYIVIDIYTDPYPAWGAEHPDDVTTNEKGQKAIVNVHDLRWGGQPQKTEGSYAERFGPSPVSAQLRRDTTKVLLQLDEYIKKSMPGKAVIGYYLSGGDDGQGFYWGDRTRQLTDYSPAAAMAWRDWLKAHYGTDAALQKAWDRADATLQNAAVPNAERRKKSTFFLDPKTDQDIIDYAIFHSEGLVDSRNIYAAALRKSHGTPIIIGAYYAGPTIGAPSQRATGYQAQSGQLDLVTSVTGYFAQRLPGGVGKAHQAWNSLSLHKMIGLAEEDFRSWKTPPYSTMEREFLAGRVETADESNAMIRRDTGHMLALGQGAWWFDLDGGWFNDPAIMRAVKESTSAFRKDFVHDDAPRADVAVFVDEYSLNGINYQNTWNYQNVLSEQIRQMSASGVPYHIYLQSDIDNPQLPHYKLYVFLNAFHITASEWTAIQRLRGGGKTLFFMHAPGILSEKMLGVADAAAAISATTGIHVAARDSQDLRLQTAPKSTFTSYSTSGYTYGHNQTRTPFTAPSFTVDDAGTVPLANYQKDNSVAVAMRDFGNWKSVFYGGVGMDAFFFNALAREAGAWTATAPGNAVYANQYFLTIHALHAGAKQIRLLQPSKIIDLTNGKVLSPNAQTFDLAMKYGETRWFALENP